MLPVKRNNRDELRKAGRVHKTVIYKVGSRLEAAIDLANNPGAAPSAVRCILRVGATPAIAALHRHRTAIEPDSHLIYHQAIADHQVIPLGHMARSGHQKAESSAPLHDAVARYRKEPPFFAFAGAITFREAEYHANDIRPHQNPSRELCLIPGTRIREFRLHQIGRRTASAADRFDTA